MVVLDQSHSLLTFCYLSNNGPPYLLEFLMLYRQFKQFSFHVSLNVSFFVSYVTVFFMTQNVLSIDLKSSTMHEMTH